MIAAARLAAFCAALGWTRLPLCLRPRKGEGKLNERSARFGKEP
jgi:hypothetical protein